MQSGKTALYLLTKHDDNYGSTGLKNWRLMSNMSLNVPHSWPRMSPLEKRYYLVNTHQAKSFSDAGRILSFRRKRKQAAQQSNPQPQVTPNVRLPYAD